MLERFAFGLQFRKRALGRCEIAAGLAPRHQSALAENTGIPEIQRNSAADRRDRDPAELS
jgi:hypothetical protein